MKVEHGGVLKYFAPGVGVFDSAEQVLKHSFQTLLWMEFVPNAVDPKKSDRFIRQIVTNYP